MLAHDMMAFLGRRDLRFFIKYTEMQYFRVGGDGAQDRYLKKIQKNFSQHQKYMYSQLLFKVLLVGFSHYLDPSIN